MTDEASRSSDSPRAWPRSALEILLWVVSFFLPITIAIGETGAFVAVAALLGLRALGRGPRLGRPLFGGLILAFLAVALLASAFGDRPAHSLGKCARLLLLGLAVVVPWVFAGDARGARGVRLAAGMFVAGAAVKAFYDVVRIPGTLAWAWLAGRGPAGVDGNRYAASTGWRELLFDLGNMRDPQMYMVALGLVAGLVLAGAWSARNWRVVLAVAVLAAAFVLHFKRGAWMAFGGAAVVLSIFARDWHLPAALAVAALLLLLVPQVRERIGQLRHESSVGMGGRRALWTEMAPVLIREHPFGMGYKAMRHEDLERISPRVQPGLDHLHNNLLQVLVETGWAGLAAWLALMGRAFQAQGVCVARLRDPAAARGLALGVSAGFAALFLDGLVENNFGDTEIQLVFAWLMGITAWLWRSARR